MSDWHDNELRNILREHFDRQQIRELGDATPFFTKLAEAFPAGGHTVDWGRVPGSVRGFEMSGPLQMDAFLWFFDEVIREFGLTGDVVYIGDNLTDVALAGSVACMRDVALELLAIPQHHYFVAADVSWCLSFTMIGGMAFGFRPEPAS